MFVNVKSWKLQQHFFFYLSIKACHNIQVWKLKLMQMCLTFSFFITTSRGQLLWLQNEGWLYRSLWENDPTSPLICSITTHFPKKLRVLITSCKSNLIQHGVHFVDYGPIYRKYMIKQCILFHIGLSCEWLVATVWPRIVSICHLSHQIWKWQHGDSLIPILRLLNRSATTRDWYHDV